MRAKKEIPERWYEVFGLCKKDFSSIEPEDMLRIPGHVFLKF
jgi:hypothetical protein